jgi:hypothetical protein
MEGVIDKWTNNIFKWKERYVVIKNGELRYYQNKGGKLKGLFSLIDAKVEMVDNEPLRITIDLVDDIKLSFKCKTLAEKTKWVNAICTTQQSVNTDSINKDEVLDSFVNEDRNLLKEVVTRLFKNRILNNSSKLNAYVTQVWTFQGLLEAALSDFSEDLLKIVSPPNSLKEAAENIKRYTMELKHCVYKAVQEIDETKTELMDKLKHFVKEGSPGHENNSLNEMPIIMKSKPPNDNEAVSDDSSSEVFYDAVEEDSVCTPIDDSASVVPSFTLNLQKPTTLSKPRKHEVTLSLSSL